MVLQSINRVLSSSPDKAETSKDEEMFESPRTKAGSPWSYIWNRTSSERRLWSWSSGSSTTSRTSTLESQSSLTSTPTLKCSPLAEVSSDKSIELLCSDIKKQIISRAFYGWLAHCRHLRILRTHLPNIVNSRIVDPFKPKDARGGLKAQYWRDLHDENGAISTDHEQEIYRLIYFGGVAHEIRKEVWPYLLNHYQFGQTKAEREERDKEMHIHYETTMTEWLAVEAIVRQRDKEIMAANLARFSSESNQSTDGCKDVNISQDNNDVFTDSEDDGNNVSSGAIKCDSCDRHSSEECDHISETLPNGKKSLHVKMRRQRQVESQDSQQLSTLSMLVTNATFDSDNLPNDVNHADKMEIDSKLTTDADMVDGTTLGIEKSPCISPASSSGGIYTTELLDSFSLNLHHIDKDVPRVDRNYWYYASKTNLEKLRNVTCTYVWQHLDNGYVQEVLSYSCFCELMKRMMANFPNGGAITQMDNHFANMRSLTQIVDNEIYELMRANGDYTYFYFCYRWFLLDFKRELVYDDVFRVWETIWAAKHVASSNFVLFVALALVENYRDLILENNMDATDIIKFFNDMAEQHDSFALLKASREIVFHIQTLLRKK